MRSTDNHLGGAVYVYFILYIYDVGTKKISGIVYP